MSSRSADTMTRSGPREVVERALSAMAAGDFGAATAEFGDDAVWEIVGGTYVPQGNRYEGKAAIERDFFGDLIPSVFDFTEPFGLEIRRVDAAGERVYVEWVVDGTAARGGHYRNEYCVIFTVDDGLITGVREYANTELHKRVLFG